MNVIALAPNRRDIVDSFNVELPATFEEYQAALRKQGELKAEKGFVSMLILKDEPKATVFVALPKTGNERRAAHVGEKYAYYYADDDFQTRVLDHYTQN